MAYQGVIRRVVHQGERTGLEIDGRWYSLFAQCDLSEGDHVEFDYKTVKRNGKTYYNIETIRKIDHPAGETSETERIARAVALKAAVASFASLSGEHEATAEEIVQRAEVFLDFLLGPEGRTL